MTAKPLEVPAELRELAEKSVEQARKAFDGFLGAATRTVDALQTSQTSAQANAADMTQKALGYVGDNVAAAFDLAQNMARARDPQDMMRLQAEFMQRQMAAFQQQVKDLGGAAQKATQSLQSAAQDMVRAKKD